jgi:23S rRNA (guanosine2251-2'-O)-methyltransferase
MSVLEPHYAGVAPERLPPIVRNPVHVVLDNIRSAFNVGSIFRTADAGAVEHIHLCGYTCHPPNDKLAKTALGAFDYVPWTRHDSTAHALDALHRAGLPIIAVEVAQHAVSYSAFAWPRPVALVFGNEVKGVQPDILGQCDAAARVPMKGYKNSINVATVFGIVLFEVLRQWGTV